MRASSAQLQPLLQVVQPALARFALREVGAGRRRQLARQQLVAQALRLDADKVPCEEDAAGGTGVDPALQVIVE